MVPLLTFTDGSGDVRPDEPSGPPAGSSVDGQDYPHREHPDEEDVVQPFEKHPADAGALQAYGEDLIDQGSQALQLGRSTRAAYQPAVPAVQGVPAAAVAAAPIPVDRAADATSGALVWGAVATQYWGKQVGDFNTAVDSIVAELQAAEAQARTAAGAAANAPGPNGAPAGPTAPGANAQPALDAAMLAAREKWFEAYRVHIEAGQAQATAMLAQGPTAQNAAVARDSGVMPGVQLDLLGQLVEKSGARAGLVHPDGQGLLGSMAFGAERGLNVVGYGDKLWKARHMTFIPRPHGQFVNRAQWTADTRFLDRAKGYGTSKYWVPRRGQAGNAAAWKTASRFAKPAAPVVSGVAGVVDQWTRDAGRTDIGTGERAGRAALRGGINAAGSWAGAAAGAKIGALGGAFFGPVGFAVGGIGGAIVGGIAGSALASEGADAILDNG